MIRRSLLVVQLLWILWAGFLGGSLVFGMDNPSGGEGIDGKKRENTIQPGHVQCVQFRSRIDNSIQSFLLQTPAQYRADRSWPLLVTLHGMGDGPILAPNIQSMVQISPTGRGSIWYEGIGEKDVLECIEETQKRITIDKDRIYLCGFSMGADATFNLGLRSPHRWAACVPVCGKYDDINDIPNGRYLPYFIHVGAKDSIRPPSCCLPGYRRARELDFACWEYAEYPRMNHCFRIDWPKVEKWLLQYRRVQYPKQVSFGTADLNASQAYWVQILGLEKYSQRGTIEASIEGQTIRVVTDNVRGYRLNVAPPLLDIGQRISVVENGRTVFTGLPDANGFITVNPNSATRVKRPGLCGPLWDIYSAPTLLVIPSAAGTPELIESAKRCAESFRCPLWMPGVNFKLVTDAELTQADIQANNLVLFGNRQINRVLARVADQLPIRTCGQTILAGNQSFTGEKIGFVLIYPNPLNPAKYLAVFHGFTPETINCFDTVWPAYFDDVPKLIDAGVFEVLPQGQVAWKLKTVFGSQWEWPNQH